MSGWSRGKRWFNAAEVNFSCVWTRPIDVEESRLEVGNNSKGFHEALHCCMSARIDSTCFLKYRLDWVWPCYLIRVDDQNVISAFAILWQPSWNDGAWRTRFQCDVHCSIPHFSKKSRRYKSKQTRILLFFPSKVWFGFISSDMSDNRICNMKYSCLTKINMNTQI